MQDLKAILDSRFSWNEIIVFKEKKCEIFISVRDVFTKYAGVKPFKDKKSKIALNAFI